MKPTYRKFIPRFTGTMILAAATAFNARADYPSTLLSHGPVAYWEFNETAASPAPFKLANSGSLGSIADAYASVSTINGVSGVVGHAVQFSNPVGTGHVGSRADVVYNPALNSPVFTIEFWAQPSATFFSSGSFDATGGCPLSNFNPENYPGGRVGYLFYVSGTSAKWNFRLGLASGYAVNIVSPVTASAGVWQHVVATYDGSVVNLYINGALAGSATSSAAATGWVPNTGSFIRFGGTPLNGDGTFFALDTAGNQYFAPLNDAIDTAGNRGWDGLLDEVAIYNTALSGTTVAAHYGTGTTNAAGYHALILASHPVGYWSFDEPAITPPNPSTFPVAVNAGSLGSAANGTNTWGAVAAQPGPSYSGFPASNKAVTFDGLNSSFQVNETPGLHFTNNITLAAWVKPSADDSVREIISHGPDTVGSETFLRITRGNGYGTGYFYEVGTCDGLFGEYYDSVQFPIPAGDIGNWVLLAGTFDGTNWNLFRNGVLVGQTQAYVSATDQDTGAVDVTNSWAIGSRSLPNEADGWRFAGSIDEPAIFTNALTPDDISALYSAAQAPPVITQAPQNPGTVFKGSTVSFSVWAEGSPTLSYMWTSNGIPTGVTTTNYSISNIPVGAFTVGVTVSNPYGTNSPSVTFSSVAAPPTIVTPPASATRFVGYPFSFSVVAGGSSPLFYYWKLGANVVQAGASASYSGVASLSNAGSYTVVVSNETTLSVTSAPAVLTVNPVPSGYGGTIIGSGPIAYYRLDELSGSICHDGIGGFDGVYNNATLGVPGYSVVDSDTAASFSGINSYVGSISGTGINFTGHTNFSLEVWVNAPAGQNDEATIIGKGIGAVGTTRTEQFSIDVSSGAYRFFSTHSGNIIEADAVSGPDGTWQHIVAVYDDQNTTGSGTNMYIYVNGALEGTHAVIPQGLNNTTSPISIGSKRTGNDPAYDGTFNGTVDEVAIYNYALDATTVQAHYAAAYGTNLAPFVSVQPVPTTNYAGLPQKITVQAAGTVPLSYTWKKNNSPVSGANISGEDSAILVISPLTYADAGVYSVSINNSVGATNSVSVPLVVLPPPTSPPVIPGCVLHLTFETNLTDVTGRGNDGTGFYTANGTVVASNAVTVPMSPALNSGINPSFYYVPDGALGTALHYETDAVTNGNGTTSIGTNDFYVSLGVRPDLQFGSNVDFTVSYWIRLPLAYDGGDLPFFTDAAGSEGNNGFVFAPAYGFGTASGPTPNPTPVNFGGWAYTIYGGGNGVRIYGDEASINNQTWFHLVHVFNRSAGTGVTYLNGTVAHYTKNAGTTITAAGDIDTGLPATIGQDPTGQYGESGTADIDDLAVWRRALSPLEVASIYVAAVSNQFSFTSPVTLTVKSLSNGGVRLSWPSGTLQTAPSVNGPYTSLPSAVSPYTNSTTGSKQFYRVKQ